MPVVGPLAAPPHLVIHHRLLRRLARARRWWSVVRAGALPRVLVRAASGRHRMTPFASPILVPSVVGASRRAPAAHGAQREVSEVRAGVLGRGPTLGPAGPVRPREARQTCAPQDGLPEVRKCVPPLRRALANGVRAVRSCYLTLRWSEYARYADGYLTAGRPRVGSSRLRRPDAYERCPSPTSG